MQNIRAVGLTLAGGVLLRINAPLVQDDGSLPARLLVQVFFGLIGCESALLIGHKSVLDVPVRPVLWVLVLCGGRVGCIL